MVIFLYGEESFRRQQRLKILREAFQSKFDPAGHNVSRLDGGDFSIDEFRKQTKSAGLFSSKRFIALTNLWKLNKDDQDALGSELAGVDADTILVISADQPPRKDNRLFKQLLKSEKVELYGDLEPGQLRAFIQKTAKDYGSTIEPAAIEKLTAAIGNDLWRLSSELKKLSQTEPGTPITAAQVDDQVDQALDDNIFHLTDALGARDARRASQLLAQQFALGANEHYLLTMLARQISTLLKVKRTNGTGLKLHPYVIQKSQAQAKQFEDQRLLDLYWRLLEIDFTLKTSSTDPRVLLDLFVVESCKR